MRTCPSLPAQPDFRRIAVPRAAVTRPSGLSVPAMLTALLALASMPPRPALRSLPLPAKLAGGLILFKTSVPAADKPLAGKLLVEAQRALRSDPRVTMELGAVSDRHSNLSPTALQVG